ncbi:GGDEF domain-containing protein [Aestuariirhabdus litorea]|uniref:diguanylate cyclase n=1 Tax=Aestuariirhabdus litorea TaxID=2528527 RepID=A0A3P3VIK2_9GAMM|nr:GGDEF domain-containing protein [Aestuariirhabdus litorea]RRJ82550.1 GGDEF domain-containing protein [Aestuariirhabdus litorea]RWW92711.1 diguanylate cyclase [Endozoicomonadaceae bacterium GTF-13]
MIDESNGSADRWRSKYLKSLDERDRLEAEMQERIDQLRKTLLVVMLVCQGIDVELDSRIKELADQMRGESHNLNLGQLVDQVQQRANVVLNRKDLEQLRGCLALLLEQLKSCDIDRALQKRLSKEEKELRKTLQGYVDLPPLLNKLADHQRDVLSQVAKLEEGSEDTPFWRRLLGGARDEPREVSEPGETPVTEMDLDLDPEAESNVTEIAQEAIRDSEPQDNDADKEQPALADGEAPIEAEAETAEEPPAAAEETPTPMMDFSLLSHHVGSTLMELLGQLPVPERVVPESDRLKGNIVSGITWYELVPNLETLNRIVLATVGQSRDEFENYLKLMHDRLADFQSRAGLVRDGMARARGSNERLDASLREDIDRLQRSVSEATDLELLKLDVGERLDTILQAVETHREEVAEADLSSKLEQLTSRMASMEQETKQLKASLSRERARATQDRLTGLPNRLAYESRFNNEYARWKRYREPLVFAVADIDLFKSVNDRFGHLAGDKLLRIFARQLQKNLREVDFIARYGGEEFVILMPNTTLEEGRKVVEKVRVAIETTPLHYKSSALTITASFGVTELCENDSVASVFERADKALYQAKEAGRNQVCVATG